MSVLQPEIKIPQWEVNASTYDIQTVGEPTGGGAYTRYLIEFFESPAKGPQGHVTTVSIPFQFGDPRELVNGVTLEVLLAVCAHRLECFQAGPYPCKENAVALQHITEGLNMLHNRSRRVAEIEQDVVGDTN